MAHVKTERLADLIGQIDSWSSTPVLENERTVDNPQIYHLLYKDKILKALDIHSPLECTKLIITHSFSDNVTYLLCLEEHKLKAKVFHFLNCFPKNTTKITYQELLFAIEQNQCAYLGDFT